MTQNKLTHQIILTLDNESRTLQCEGEELLVGRDERADIVVANPKVSRQHLKIFFRNGNISIEDLGSQNGTFLDGNPIPARQAQPLDYGKRIRLGTSEIYLEVSEPAPAAQKEVTMELGPLNEEASHQELPEQATAAPQPVPTSEPQHLVEAVESEYLAEMEKQRETIAHEVSKLNQLRLDLDDTLKANRKEIADQEVRLEHLREKADGWSARVKATEQRAYSEELKLEEIQKNIDQVRAKRQELQSQCDSLKATVDEALAKVDRENQRFIELQASQKASEERQRQAEELALKAQKQREGFEEEASSLKQLLQKLADSEQEGRQKLAATLQQVQSAGERYAAEELRLKNELRDHEVEMRRRKAELETIESEARASSLKIQVDLESNRVLKATLDKDIRLAEMRRDELQAEQTRLQRDNEKAAEERKIKDAEFTARSAELEKRLAELSGRLDELNRLKSRLELETNSAATRKDQAEAEAKETQEQLNTLREESERIRAANEEALKKHREWLESDTQEKHQALEKSLQESRSRAQSLLEIENQQLRVALKDELAKARRDKHGELEVELAKKRLEEEERLAQERAAQEKELRKHRQEVARAVVQSVLKSLGTHAQAPITASLLDTVEKESYQAALRGMEAGDGAHATTEVPPTAIEQTQQAKNYWKRVSSVAGIVAAALVLLAIFPKVPGELTSKAFRTISSRSVKEDNVFLDEIKKKGEKFHPEQTKVYRDTYRDNVLYAENYTAIKTDETRKRQWTLALNDFLVGRLGLSDRTIVEFVSSEAFLVKQLAEQSANIVPQFKELAFQKLEETENAETRRLEEILGGPENYRKFRTFEKAFYEKAVSESTPETMR
jgi:pSer/pThr/pTyr-binding forkhead associated (FHA) protein